jgi:putative Ca2+/H+ antiporter (TMEM165/GDT1 family)
MESSVNVSNIITHILTPTIQRLHIYFRAPPHRIVSGRWSKVSSSWLHDSKPSRYVDIDNLINKQQNTFNSKTKSQSSSSSSSSLDHSMSHPWMNKMTGVTTSITMMLLFGVLVASQQPAFAIIPATATELALAATTTATTSTTSLWNSLTETGFYQAFSLVFLSEIGDKTFFIAGLLAMKTSRFVSYIGSMGALAAMTLLSVVIGQLFHAVPAGIAQGIPLDDVAAVVAFAFFGIKTLKDALAVDKSGSMDDELADAEETVAGSDTIRQATSWYVTLYNSFVRKSVVHIMTVSINFDSCYSL